MEETIKIRPNVILKKYTFNKDDIYELSSAKEEKHPMITKAYNIFKSNEKTNGNPESQLEEAYRIIIDLMMDEANAVIYFLERDVNDGKGMVPVSIAIFDDGRKDPNKSHMELVETHKDYKYVGYAEMLLINAFKDLQASGKTNVGCNVEYKNNASIKLHRKLIDDGVVKGGVFRDKNGVYSFDFDITKINEKALTKE